MKNILYWRKCINDGFNLWITSFSIYFYIGKTYPHRIITDLEGAREQSLRDVSTVRRKHPEFIDPHTGSDLVVLPNGKKIPCITRREFKYKTSLPDSKDNPHTAVLRGYRSRKRDEAIAFKNERDFMASTMEESRLRQERKHRASQHSSIYWWSKYTNVQSVDLRWDQFNTILW